MGCHSSKLTVTANFPGKEASLTGSPSYLSDGPKPEAPSSQPTNATESAATTQMTPNSTANQHDAALRHLSIKLTEAMELLELLDSEHHWLQQSESKSLSVKRRRAARNRFVEISGHLDRFGSEAFENLSYRLDSGAIAINPEVLARLCVHRAPRD